MSSQLATSNATTTYGHIDAGGVRVFYREAGSNTAPAIVLLHGFPSSSRQFDTLIPLLSPHFHVIAPDYPGFGHTEAPSDYIYTFDNLAQTTNDFLEALGINRYALYINDYGAPIGFRIITQHPERLQALITQNGNLYEAGLGVKWAKIKEFWADPEGHPEVLNAFLSFEGTKQRHIAGTNNLSRYNPDAWVDEFAHLSKPGQRDIQAALLYDYRTNVEQYPAWQAWLLKNQPRTLVAWGANDPSFVAAGASAFIDDLPDAEIHLLDAGHFAADEAVDTIAQLVIDFLARVQAPTS